MQTEPHTRAGEETQAGWTPGTHNHWCGGLEQVEGLSDLQVPLLQSRILAELVGGLRALEDFLSQ